MPNFTQRLLIHTGLSNMFIEICMFADDYGNIKLLYFWTEFAEEKHERKLCLLCSLHTFRPSDRMQWTYCPKKSEMCCWQWSRYLLPCRVELDTSRSLRFISGLGLGLSWAGETEEILQKFPRCRVQRSGFALFTSLNYISQNAFQHPMLKPAGNKPGTRKLKIN